MTDSFEFPPMAARLLAVWLGLQLIGLILAFAVRRQDVGRGGGRTEGLAAKFASYVGITLGVLSLGWFPAEVFSAVMLTWLTFCILEFQSALERSEEEQGEDLSGLGAAVPIVVTAGFVALFAVRSIDPLGGLWGFLWLVVSTTDAYSQLFGQGWGRRPMAPVLSPAKMWEGFLGGTASAVGAGLSMGFVFPDRELVWVGAVALAVSLGASGGDLAASWVKRRLRLKDFSDLLGMHGGLLDRFDSLLGGALIFAPLLALASGFVVLW